MSLSPKILKTLCSMLVALPLALCCARNAHAQDARSLDRPFVVCQNKVLRSAGYRDMLTRLPAAHEVAQRPPETSYRDASLRHPRGYFSVTPGASQPRHRYALRPAVTCG